MCMNEVYSFIAAFVVTVVQQGQLHTHIMLHSRVTVLHKCIEIHLFSVFRVTVIVDGLKGKY